MEDLFEKIVAGEIPAEKIYEDDETFAFLDIKPTNRGHALMIPKKHYANFLETPDDLACAITKAVKIVAPAVQRAVNADGVNMISNIESAAGQVIFHTHVHIVPRFADDGFRHWQGSEYQEGQMQEVANTIRAELSS